MDENNRPRFEYTPKFSKSIDINKDQPSLPPDQVKQKDAKIDFWSSRGNIGEKINLLIGMNLLLIDLLSTLVKGLRSEDTLSNDIITVLARIQDFFSKMLTQPDSGLGINEIIVEINGKITSLLDEISSTSTLVVTPEKKQSALQPGKIIGQFKRNTVDQDKWGIIESIDQLLISYMNLSHLGFPNYYFTACKELHKYEYLQRSLLPKQYDIIQIPSFKLRDLISKFLREAPAARLLQNLRKMFPAEHDSDITSPEQNQVQDIVEKYYRNISEYLEDHRDLKDSLRISSTILKSYNLGTGDMESRIPNVSFNIVKEIQLELQKNPEDVFKQYILSETIILIHRLNDSLLQNERFVFFLRSLK